MPGTIESALQEHSCLLLDSCVWIYHIEDHPIFAPLTTKVLQQVASGRNRAVSSELSLLEIKIQPLRQGREDIADEYELLLEAFPNLTLCPIIRPILHLAGLLRARLELKTPDAIILATGLENGATCVVTNDRSWRRFDGMEVVCLNDYAA